MKKFKRVDFAISAALVIAAAVFIGLDPDRWMAMIFCYMVIGAWQLVSMVVHIITGYFTQAWGIRFIYHWISFIAIATLPLGSYWILTYVSPFMALFYTGLCYREILRMKRPMDLLK